MKEGKVGPGVHKHPITSEQMQEIFRSCQELGDSNTKDPSQLMRTAWFYLTLYFGKRGRENEKKTHQRNAGSVNYSSRKTVL